MADVIVVGGGPAGATTALLLARQGRRVTIVEREPFPRPKACGDCLSAAATGLLRRLGLLDRVLAAGAAPIRDWRIRAPAGHDCRGDLHGASAYALERRHLDAILLHAAVEAGARLVHGHVLDLLAPAGVAVRNGGGEARARRARLVVGADGLRSIVARRAGLVRRRPRLRKVSLTTHGCGAAGGLDHGEMHVLDGACFGLAPAGRGRFNLTLVVHDSRAADLGALGPDAFFDRWLGRAPAVRDRVAGAALERPFLASGPFDWPTRSPIGPRLALVGDAAGYYDPFTGQGVYQALEGGRLLAGALEGIDLAEDAALTAALRRYARALRRLKRPARRVQRLVEVALARPARANRVIRRLAAAPAVAAALVEVTGDLRPASALLSPGLLSTFVFPPLPGGPMITIDERATAASPSSVFRAAADVERWPEILPHYRWVRFREKRGFAAGTVEMAAWREFGGPLRWPTWWLSEMESEPDVPVVRYRHIDGITRGMDVRWEFVPAVGGGTLVRVVHEWDGPAWPLIGGFAANAIIGPHFVSAIAERTLAGVCGAAERAAAAEPGKERHGNA